MQPLLQWKCDVTGAARLVPHLVELTTSFLPLSLRLEGPYSQPLHLADPICRLLHQDLVAQTSAQQSADPVQPKLQQRTACAVLGL